MEEKLVHKFIAKVKDKLSMQKTSYPSGSDYAFSTEELANITRENKQKIQELKQDMFVKKEKVKKQAKIDLVADDNSSGDDKTVTESSVNQEKISSDGEEQRNHTATDEVISLEKKENFSEIKDKLNLEQEKTQKNEEVQVKVKPKNSFVNLDSEYQEIVMSKWEELDSNQVDKDIMKGKDLLNHNYTITYADEAARFIHEIRKRYEVVICYLIGFNNEKKGVYDKTIFSSKVDDEWKYLGNYIKVLEKIRSFKK